MNDKERIRRLDARVEYMSRRIKKLSRKFTNYVDNNKYYLKKRLPSVLKNEKMKSLYLESAMKSMDDLRKMLNMVNFLPKIHKRNSEYRLYPVFLTHAERLKLQRFLELRKYTKHLTKRRE